MGVMRCASLYCKAILCSTLVCGSYMCSDCEGRLKTFINERAGGPITKEQFEQLVEEFREHNPALRTAEEWLAEVTER